MEPIIPKIPASVGILTRDSAASLPSLLGSLVGFEDVFIVDGGSRDATLDIARAHERRAVSQDPRYLDDQGRIRDFGGLRNQSLSVAKHPWFLFVDSDEALSARLIEEIRAVVIADVPGAYWVPRMYVYRGERVACSISYPNRQMRFFHTDAVEGFRKPVHERVVVKPGARVGELLNPILVPVAEDIAGAKRKSAYYIRLELDRHGPTTLGRAFRTFFEAKKLTLLYLFRYLRMRLFCRGTRLPDSIEFLAIGYQWRMAGTALSRLFHS